MKLRKNGYKRHVESLYRVMVRMGIYKKTPSKKKENEPKEYEKMTYPGERVQVDVKYVSRNCMPERAKEWAISCISHEKID